ncbi:hypothetical protein DEU56DRAFT_414793 [Suillus clintonianus]|uniref:uncharacterized protein n=1 Tax=Suillus clintonianus TaxID=1904413 RepID=UPI001B8608E4|nr:uncharacterized protein DEU56DRAFT_414793 [Suillus clintonianus]KAG2133717.1 hypothetical protein DEU56DRAFT_414793 [Suillus clintonianus]
MARQPVCPTLVLCAMLAIIPSGSGYSTGFDLTPKHITTIPTCRSRPMSCGWQEVSDLSPNSDSTRDDLQFCRPAPSQQGNLKTTRLKSTEHSVKGRSHLIARVPFLTFFFQSQTMSLYVVGSWR